jgi:hypothetical protein
MLMTGTAMRLPVPGRGWTGGCRAPRLLELLQGAGCSGRPSQGLADIAAALEDGRRLGGIVSRRSMT